MGIASLKTHVSWLLAAAWQNRSARRRPAKHGTRVILAVFVAVLCATVSACPYAQNLVIGSFNVESSWFPQFINRASRLCRERH